MTGDEGVDARREGRLRSRDPPALGLIYEVFLKSFCKSQFPYKFVNLFFVLVIVNDELTNLWGRWLLQNQQLCCVLQDTKAWTRGEKGGFEVAIPARAICHTQSDLKVVLQTSMPTQIRLFALDASPPRNRFTFLQSSYS